MDGKNNGKIKKKVYITLQCKLFVTKNRRKNAYFTVIHEVFHIIHRIIARRCGKCGNKKISEILKFLLLFATFYYTI